VKSDKLLTVRIPGSRLRKLMRARGVKRQSDLINRLLEEEEERLESLSVLRRTAGTMQRSDFDDRLL
jgi:predicted CopG family antitoxin